VVYAEYSMVVASPALDLTGVRKRTSRGATQSNGARLEAAGRAAAIARELVPVIALLVILSGPDHAIPTNRPLALDACSRSILVVFTFFARFDLLIPTNRRLAHAVFAESHARLTLRSGDQINATREQLVAPAHGVSEPRVDTLRDNLGALASD